ncbi:MAG: hypothetical protein QXS27_09040 [Candidatus Jordarchaeaceae archaeon]
MKNLIPISRADSDSLEIHYSKHLSQRLKIRKIPRDLPKTVLLKAEKRFIDTRTGHRIAIKKMSYGGEERFIMVAFDISDKGITMITCHPIKEKQVSNRIKSGRWKHEGEKNSQDTLR